MLLVAAGLSAGLIVALHPLLERYALARPNARSSHTKPTPQGGGIAVVAATLAGVWLGALVVGFSANLLALTIAVVLLAAVGTVDDLRGLGSGPTAADAVHRRGPGDRDAAGGLQHRAAVRLSGPSAG